MSKKNDKVVDIAAYARLREIENRLDDMAAANRTGSGDGGGIEQVGGVDPLDREPVALVGDFERQIELGAVARRGHRAGLRGRGQGRRGR